MFTFPFKIHAYLRAALLSKKGVTARPDATAIRLSKSYPRMQKIALPIPESRILLNEALAQRTSVRPKTIKSLLTLKQLGELFGLAVRERSNKSRPYPSGGSLYPIEIYVVTTLEDKKQTIAYHYQPKEHVLEQLWAMPEGMKVTELLMLGGEPFEFTGCIVCTVRWHRTVPKYGDFAYTLALLEAGHIVQNILLSAVAADVSACPMVGFFDKKIVELLDLNRADEQVVYCVAIASNT